MWLMTEEGFTSVVAHREKEGILLVRGRAKEDLVALCRIADEGGIEGVDPSGIWEDGAADYRWRMEVDRQALAALAAALVERIDYDNFKSRVGERDPEREAVYHRVWRDLLAVGSGG